MLAGAALCNAALGSLFAWSVVAGPVARDLGVGAGETGSVFSVALAVFTVGVLTAGPVADRRGARPLLLLAAAAGAAGLALAAAIGTYVGLLVGAGFGFGAANGIGYSAALHVAGTAWPGRRGVAIGIVLSAYALGGVVAAPALTAAVTAAGWRTTVGGWAVVVAAVVLCGAALVPRRPAAPASPRPWSVARGRVVVLLWVVFAGCAAPALFAFGHAADVAAIRGASAFAAAVAVAVLAGGNLAGRLAGGWAADRFGPVPSLLATAAAGVVASVLLAGVPAAVVVAPAFLLLGSSYGAVSALVPAATAEIVGPDRLAGTYGRIFPSWGVAGLVAPVAGGWLVEVTGSYEAAFAAGAIVAAGAVAGALRLRRPAPASGG